MTQKTSPALIILVVASALVVLVFGSYTLGKQSVTPPPVNKIAHEPIVIVPDDSSPIPTPQPQVPDVVSKEVRVETQKNFYSVGEQISFTILNTTQKNVYYFPDTCASRIIDVLSLRDGRLELLPGPDMMCAMAPQVVTLQPGNSVIEKVPEYSLQQMKMGSYKLQFTYSYEEIERFSLGEKVISQSNIFTVSE